MKAVIVFFIGLLSLPLCSQGNIKKGSSAPEIHIDKWLLNKPRKKSLKDKFIVLDFWATWCAPCLANVPHINSLQDHFSDENIIFLQMTRESSSTARKVFDNVDFRTPVVTDKLAQTHISFGDGVKDIAYYPMAVLIDDMNIIRWFGDSEQLSVEMIQKLLQRKNIEVDQMKFDGPHDISRGLEHYLNSEFGLKKWSYMFQDPDILFDAYIAESPVVREEKIIEVSMSVGGIWASKSLEEILKSIYPHKQFVFPESISSNKYDFYYVNKELDADSDDRLLDDIADQLGLETVKIMASGFYYEIEIRDPTLLVSSKEEKVAPPDIDPAGQLSLKKSTLQELAITLSKKSNDLWTFRPSTNQRFKFIIDMTSYENIVKSLEGYGLKVKERETTIEVIEFIKDE